MLLPQLSEKLPLLVSGAFLPEMSFGSFGAEIRRELEFLKENPCSIETERIFPLDLLLVFPRERRAAVLNETLRFEDWLYAASVRIAQFLAGLRTIVSEQQIDSLLSFPVLLRASGLAEFARNVLHSGEASPDLLTEPVICRDAVLLDFIARGSTSAVYRAEWNRKICAFKQALTGFETRFRKELEILSELDPHPNLPTVFFTFSGKDPYCIMELCRTGKCAGKLQFESGFLRALDFLHERGILHGDIRRSNLGISSRGTPVLIDFSHAVRFCAGAEMKFRNESEQLKRLLA